MKLRPGPQLTRPATGRTMAPLLHRAFKAPLVLLTFGLSSCHLQGEPRALSPRELRNGGLLLPDGFEAVVVVDSIGPARHLIVNDNGDIYVKLRRADEDGGIVALRDTNDDGRADVIQTFGHYAARGTFETSVKLHKGYLYFSTNLNVYRYPLIPGQLLPDTSRLETIVIDDHEHGTHEHQTKPLAFDDEGNMYVPFGVPTDTCQDPNRIPGVRGRDPCPDLELHAGIWRFDEDRPNQTQADGIRYASGIRSVVAMDWNPADRRLYAMQHGRDYLFRQWPGYYSRWDSAVLPSEEFMRVTEGANFGWPFCYFDHLQGKRMLGPEYGGDGDTVGRCSAFDNPIVGFPGHFAPNALQFYRGNQFSEYYRNGAFVAFHGSTIRDPYSQAGYFVAFVPFNNGTPAAAWDVFANGFAGMDPIPATGDAEHRPMGLAVGPDGSLYIADSVVGTVWKVTYTGDRNNFGPTQLARMQREKETAQNIRTPHPVDDNLERDAPLAGETLYRTYCSACHNRTGVGSPPRFPPIAGTEWVTADSRRLISIVLNGMTGPITVRGEAYDSSMPAFASHLDDAQVAALLSYVRQNFGGGASSIDSQDVREVRNP